MNKLIKYCFFTLILVLLFFNFPYIYWYFFYRKIQNKDIVVLKAKVIFSEAHYRSKTPTYMIYKYEYKSKLYIDTVYPTNFLKLNCKMYMFKNRTIPIIRFDNESFPIVSKSFASYMNISIPDSMITLIPCD